MATEAEKYSTTRYEYHHSKWIEAMATADSKRADQHLYALRAHLHHLGWLASEYDMPGYGVRKERTL